MSRFLSRSRFFILLLVLGLATATALAQTIPNASFESNTFTVFPGYASGNGGAITGWTLSNAGAIGLNPAGGSPFADNGAVPDGTRVAFIQSLSGQANTLSTTITGLTVGQKYTVIFRANSRSGAALPANGSCSVNGGSFAPFKASPAVGGTNGYYTNSRSFTATATTAALAFRNQTANDSALLLDAITIQISPEISLEQPAGTALTTGNVTAWGFNANGQCNVPAGLNGVKAITAGGYWSLALMGDGTVRNWGLNNGIPAGLSDVVALAAGDLHSLALKSDGSVVGWGNNSDGQTNVPANLAPAIGIAATSKGSGAVLADGTMVNWGLSYALPPEVTNIVELEGGFTHFVARKSDGTVMTWGGAPNGPGSIPAGLNNVVSVAAGWTNNIAVKSDGTVVAWPTDVSPASTGVVAVAMSAFHQLALLKEGTVVTSGNTEYGKQVIPAGLSGVRAISANGSSTIPGEGHSLALWDSTVDFGDQGIATNAARSFTLKNTAGGPLHVQSVDVVGPDAARFAVSTAGMLTTVPANTGSTTFSVTFTSGTIGPKHATLRITSDDPDEGVFYVHLTGNGIILASDIAVYENNESGHQLTDNSDYTYFDAPVGSSSATKTFMIKNYGNINLTGLALTKAGDFPGDFAVGSLGATTLAPNATTTFTVACTPGGAGDRTAILNIASNDIDENPFEIHLHGRGLVSEITVLRGENTVWPEPPPPLLTNNVGVFTFPSTTPGSSVTQLFTIRNSGGDTLTGLALSKSGPDAGDFTLSALPTTSLPTSARETTFTLTFTPSGFQSHSAVIAIASNDADENPFLINVAGSGVGKDIAVEQPAGTARAAGSSLSFGNVPDGQTKILPFTLRNFGNQALELTGTPKVVITGANASEFTVTTPPASPVAAFTLLTLADAGFEIPVQVANGFTYSPTGSSWTFGSTAGVARNGSPWFVNSAPEGSQAAFIQKTGAAATITRTVNFPATGAYEIRFQAVRRGGIYQANDVEVRVDGAILGTVPNTAQPDNFWRTFSFPYLCTVAGNYTLQLAGMRPGGDYNSAIDNVQIRAFAETTFEVQFDPSAAGARSAALSILNDDAGESPYVINLSGTALTALESWRLLHFASILDAGNSANAFDFDLDGVVNLVEFAFGLHPKDAASSQLPPLQGSIGNLFYSFPTPPGVSGITYGAEWTATLNTNDWHIIPDTGLAPQHLFIVPPTEEDSQFLRFKITAP